MCFNCIDEAWNEKHEDGKSKNSIYADYEKIIKNKKVNPENLELFGYYTSKKIKDELWKKIKLLKVKNISFDNIQYCDVCGIKGIDKTFKIKNICKKHPVSTYYFPNPTYVSLARACSRDARKHFKKENFLTGMMTSAFSIINGMVGVVAFPGYLVLNCPICLSFYNNKCGGIHDKCSRCGEPWGSCTIACDNETKHRLVSYEGQIEYQEKDCATTIITP